MEHRRDIQQLITAALSDPMLTDEELERIDEIHRSAVYTAHKIAGTSDKWDATCEDSLYKELLRLQGQIRQIRRSAALRENGMTRI